MSRYTTITVSKELLMELEEVKRRIGASSLKETIETLIEYWRTLEASSLASDITETRKKGDLSEFSRIADELRRLKWARFTQTPMY
jgi:predicted DNA-binding protein